MGEFNHFDKNGNAVMVDVSGKEPTYRTAVAQGKILVSEETLQAVLEQKVKKGDVLGVARVAGIMAVKQTSSIIPMCHPLMIQKCSVDFQVLLGEQAIQAVCTVKTEGKTGVEMEAPVSYTHLLRILMKIQEVCPLLIILQQRMEKEKLSGIR